MMFGSEGNPITLADLIETFTATKKLVRGNTRIAYSTRDEATRLSQEVIELGGVNMGLVWKFGLWKSNMGEVFESSARRVQNTECNEPVVHHGRRHDLCDRNPIEWVRQGAKRPHGARIS